MKKLGVMIRQSRVGILLLLACAGIPFQSAASPTVILVEAEGFESFGGWVLDTQFMDQIGSPFLLAHGLGEPVADAATRVAFPEAKQPYHVWVRTRDWVAPWKVPGTPGRFQLRVNEAALPITFGTEGAEWHWQDGGLIELSGSVALALHDLTGFEGRCDVILFTSQLSFMPPNRLKDLAAFRQKTMHRPKLPKDGGAFDLVVVGGGIAGSATAVTAARLGLKVALVQDRPVLGGNGSSEVRVWPEGNIQQPPYRHVGDVVAELTPTRGPKSGNRKSGEVYEDDRKLQVVRNEPGITLILDHRVNGVEVRRGKIASVIAENVRTGEKQRLQGRWFADCTGDGVVGFLAGADFEVTKEGHQGGSNLWSVEDTGAAQPFPGCLCQDTNALSTAFTELPKPAPFPRCPWAVDLSQKMFPGRKTAAGQWRQPGAENFGDWFWESGFDRDPITDIEWIRDQNFRAMYGAWDALKNVDRLYPNHKLAWAAFILGKRESRRLMGDVVLGVDDFRTNRVFIDGAFPCSWHIDVHSPDPAFQKGHEGAEFISQATAGTNYLYQGPYWAPYRCLYSRNIANLFMAGRDISVTHEALGPVRVMKTCGMMGEIVGMAASLCAKHNVMPRDIYTGHLKELQSLMTTGSPHVQRARPSN